MALIDSNGNIIPVGSGSGATINSVGSRTKFEDFKETGWYNIPSTWYQLICSTMGIVATNDEQPAYGGLLHVVASTNYIRYEFYPSGGNGKTLDAGQNTNAFGYSAFGYEEPVFGHWYFNNEASIKWYRSETAFTDRLMGKKVVILGDSIPAGFRNFYGFMCKHNCVVENKANGGCSIAYRTSDHSNQYDNGSLVAVAYNVDASSSYYADVEGADIILIWMGTNDFGNSLPIGEIGAIGGSFNDTTTVGALQKSIEKLISRNGGANIIAMLPMWRFINSGNYTTFETYINAIKSVYELYNIPCKDMYHECGCNILNRASLLDSAGLHPSGVKGNAMIRGKLEAWIEQNC